MGKKEQVAKERTDEACSFWPNRKSESDEGGCAELAAVKIEGKGAGGTGERGEEKSTTFQPYYG